MARITGSFTVHVAPASQGQPLTLTPASGALPDEQVGVDATGSVVISGGTPPYKLDGVDGLPPGVSAALDADGVTVRLSGQPTVSGDGSVGITVSDSAV